MEINEIQIKYSNQQSLRIKLNQSKEVYETVKKSWNMDTIEIQEEFKVLLLNRYNELLGIYPLSKGGSSGTIVDAKLVYSVALKANASNIIFIHNHPSGNIKPSESDIRLTEKLKKGGELLDIMVIDHIIISKDTYYSLADHRDM